MKPTTILTTSKNATSKQTFTLLSELSIIFPYSTILKADDDHSDAIIIIKIIEQRDRPHTIRFTSINNELPIIELFIVEYKSIQQLKRKPLTAFLTPELVFGNFISEKGSIIVDWLMKLFPMKMDDLANRVVSFHPVSDFIFMRLHRYMFKDGKKVDFQDVGPHLTLRLRKVTMESGSEMVKYDRDEFNNCNVVL